MQLIDENELARNREWLLAWEREHWSRKEEGLRLHLGSGHLHLSEYVNVDPYTPESDCKDDMRYLSFASNSAIEIVSHHALEHIPIRDVYPTLQHWYDILAPGGTLEIGIPDIELCCQYFLEASENIRWGKYIWTIYGWQTDTEGFATNTDLTPAVPLKYCEGQNHMGGFSLGYFVRMMEDIGFKMLNAFNYDGYGTPSLFVYAIKPREQYLGSLLENDTVIGTFTNTTTYISKLWESTFKYIPHIKFITRFQRGKINAGMSLLREDFLKSGKRYWCFLDHDIQFLNPDIVRNALMTLVNGKYGAVSVYSTFETSALELPYNATGLIARPHKWATGYFILVDSRMVGNILPDMNLPDGNTAVDTSYSIAIRKMGYDIAISPDYVYHFKKEVRSRPEVIQMTNDYLLKKWGQFYFNWAQYDGNVLEWK